MEAAPLLFPACPRGKPCCDPLSSYHRGMKFTLQMFWTNPHGEIEPLLTPLTLNFASAEEARRIFGQVTNHPNIPVHSLTLGFRGWHHFGTVVPDQRRLEAKRCLGLRRSILMCLFNIIGPVATIIASITAASITGYFAWRQMQIARQQAATARDQLRYNLFTKRYEIYEAARKAVEITFEKRDDDRMPNAALDPLFLKFEESRFVFEKNDNIESFLAQLRKDIEAFLKKNYSHRGRNIDQNNPAARKVSLDEEAHLRTLEEALYITQQQLPKRFAHAIRVPAIDR